jgi:probable F420-dependent oxidoreductase
MDIGLTLSNAHLSLWPELAQRAEAAGFESVWIPEHLVVPVASTGSPMQGHEHPPVPSNIPILDPMATLAHLAALTERIKLGTQVYNIGLRHPFITARGAATVDILSDGRLLLGIGASWLRAEWDAVGLDFESRGARVDEAIEVCNRLWTEPEVEHHGRVFDVGATAFEPKPVQQPIALHVGGDGPAAMRRAATIGAGWIPMNHALEQLPASIERIQELAAEHGRTTPIEVTVVGSVTTPDDLERYAAAGVTRVVVRPWTRSREALDGVARFGDEVISTLS